MIAPSFAVVEKRDRIGPRGGEVLALYESDLAAAAVDCARRQLAGEKVTVGRVLPDGSLTWPTREDCHLINRIYTRVRTELEAA